MTDRNRLLLGIALALAALRFLLVPWLEHQAAAAESLTVLTQRLDRSAGVVQNRAAIEQSLKDITASASAARQRFPDAADSSAFRLDVQQGASALVTQSGLTLRIFEWILDGRTEGARLEYSRARIQFEGGFKTLVTTQANLEARFPNMVIRELNFNAPTPIAAPDLSMSSVTLVADFYFRPTGVGASAGGGATK